MTTSRTDRQNILGVRINTINLPQAVSQISSWIDQREPQYVCVTPAHGVMDGYNSPEVRRIFNSSGMTTPDGMAIVWLLKLYGHNYVNRVYGPDLLLATCQAGLTNGWRHFFYGGKPGVADDLAAKLEDRFPDIDIAGTYCPPFRQLTSDEVQSVEEIIRAAQPDVVWVGLSTPKQERWMARFVDRLGVPVLVGIGAAFDFLSGAKVQAPRWVQRSGLEWLFRLMSEPRRLWPRYRQYPKFVFLALGQRLGLFKFQDEVV